MHHFSWLKLVILFIILLAAVPITSGAAPPVSFRMTAEDKGCEIEVAVLAEDVTDLYAFDLLLAVDSDTLRLKKATSGMQGFTVAPLLEGDILRFAHTKIGDSSGSNGTVTLAVLLFERIGEEAPAIRLVQAQLVNSQLEMDSFTPDTKISLKPLAQWDDIVGHWAEAFIRLLRRLP
ncbi:hypothetical protein IDH44_09785 [Paenibacillus sp. IB182496]|uniref:Cohesin domain-containing protein n=1 Tax=Paenibacillus sabuli TaxID=2772509 RepID=A0A927GRG9_9BACL|nr:cohesin domain-containing protein [Paenibacillus sabuli]MBD2845478.1 hypothetical protein [Paenibacillus sabuli]